MHLVALERWWLWAAPALALCAALAWVRSPVILAWRSKRRLWALRAAALVLACLALADVKVLGTATGDGGRKVVLLVDVSESIPPAERARAGNEARALAEGACRAAGTPVEVLLFNERVAEVGPVGGLSPEAFADRERELREGAGASDLGSALTRALGDIPEGARGQIVVWSDGRPTEGDLERAVQAARLRAVRVDAVPLQSRATDGLWVQAFKVPEKVFILENFPVEALIASQAGGQVRVRLSRDATQLANEVVEVRPGVTRWEYTGREERVGRLKYSFRVEPLSVPDGYEENNVQVAAVNAETVPRVLIVTMSEADLAPFLRALKDATITYKVIPQADFPHGLSGLSPYAAVVMDNVPADELRKDQLDLLKTYVRDNGGGFVMLGGKKSFGMGGYSDTSVEEMSPVTMTPPTYTTSFALVLLLDASSSMTGFPIQWVRRAAKQIIWLMRGKYLGVYFFNTSPYVAVRLQRVGMNRILVEQDIDQIQALGGTAFGPALRLAANDLVGKGFSNTHVILLSDGQPADFREVQQLYPVLKAGGVKVSTVGIGSSVDENVLRDVAQNCDGRFYLSTELHRLPEIFEAEVKRIIGPPYVEEPFKPVAEANSELLKGVALDRMPRLGGYVTTTLKERAQLDLSSARGDVVLAHWRFGLGKAVAFTSDVTPGGWGREWAAWDEAPKLWGRVMKSVLRTHLSDFVLNVTVRDRLAVMTLDGVDAAGAYVNGAQLEARVVDPAGDALPPLRLRQSGEGRYEGSFQLKSKGFYEARIVRVREARAGDSAAAETQVAQGTVALGYSPEYRFQPTDPALLERLASATGGRVVPTGDALGAAIVRAAGDLDVSRATDTWPWLLLAALLAFVLEITVRRLNLGLSEREEEAGPEGVRNEVVSYQRIADQYVAMAQEYDRAGDGALAQQYYLRARSYFLKAQQTDQATRMWERYRYLEQKRGG